MFVTKIHVALATDDVKAALLADPASLSEDEAAEASTYWRLVALIATEPDQNAAIQAIAATLRDQFERLVTERAVNIAIDIAECEEEERFRRRNSLAYWGVQ